jgi:hypothetical protein
MPTWPSSPSVEAIEPVSRWCVLAALSLARCHRRPTSYGTPNAADQRYPIWPKPPCARVQRAVLCHADDSNDGSDARAAVPQSPCWRCLRDPALAPSPELLRASLEDVIRGNVLPELRARHRASPSASASPLRAVLAEALVQVLLEPRSALASQIDRLEAVARPLGWSALGCADLFEQAARRLGDRWSMDACTDLDVTVAMGTLRAALHAMDKTQSNGSRLTDEPPRVLVAAMPGEPHGLGAAIDCETLGLAGWDVTEAIGTTMGDLQCRLRARHYDALELSLSCVHRRDHWLPRLADVIDRARRASCNQDLAVIVRGRLFTEEPERWRTVGADGGCASATQLAQTIAAALRRVGSSAALEPATPARRTGRAVSG